MSKQKQVYGFVIWMVITFSAAAIGAIASINARGFYLELNRPDWAPPGWLFGPVWTILYILMGVSVWLVWRERGFHPARLPLLFYFIQLAANALWTWLFFIWKNGAAAFYEIIFLAALIFTTIVLFWRIRSICGLLLVPYFFWVLFAAALTYVTWVENPLLLG